MESELNEKRYPKRKIEHKTDENPTSKRPKRTVKAQIGDISSSKSQLNVNELPCHPPGEGREHGSRPGGACGLDADGSGKPSSATGMFSGLKLFILEAGIGKTRRNLFEKQVKTNGGDCVKQYTGNISHIVVDEKMDIERIYKIIKVDMLPSSVVVVKSTWISSCLKVKKLISVEGHELIGPLKVEQKVVPSDSTDKNSGNVSETKPDATSKKIVPFRFSSCVTKDIKSKEEPGEPEVKVESTFDSLLQSPDLMEDNTDESDDDDDDDKDREVPKFHDKVGKTQTAHQISDNESDYVPSGDEDETSASASATGLAASTISNTGAWICSMSSKSGAKVNHNEHITDKLEKMANLYQNTNDKWRAFSYNKAVAALKRHPNKITTWEEAKAIPGIGAKLADKIWEIAESGQLRKLDELSSRDDVATLTLFMNLWGAGPTTARLWLQMGLKTLDEVREQVNLTKQQKVGLAHYDDFLERMPREEAGEIEATVKKACHELDPGLIAHACGSYRRGKLTCGDVDILVTHPDGKSHQGVFGKLLTKLKEEGFITDDLVSHEQTGHQKKYLGVCKLPGDNKKYRRLDIIVVPYDEYACALVYFTGSAHFNRSLRHLAKKNNMSLNEHALCVGVVRKAGEKIHKGTPLPTPTEESVFKHFGLKYRPPEERDH